jgi:hypothetical protein
MLDPIQLEELQSRAQEPEDFNILAQEFEIGAWVEFGEPASKEKTQGRLSWKSNVTGKLVFINRRDIKIRSMSTAEFAEELRSGRARIVESDSSLDQTITSITSSLKDSFKLSKGKSFRLSTDSDKE